MKIRHDFLIRASWIILFLLSLGASIVLNVFSEKEVPSQTDLPAVGWLTMTYPDGRTYFYKESVGTVKKETGETVQTPFSSLFSKAPLWFFLQLVIVSIGLLLVLLKKPLPLGFSHRLNIAFGYLVVAWLNLAAFILRFYLIHSSDVPIGYVRVVPREHRITTLPAEALIILLALGFGASILLSYLWIRWTRASRPEEYFL